MLPKNPSSTSRIHPTGPDIDMYTAVCMYTQNKYTGVIRTKNKPKRKKKDLEIVIKKLMTSTQSIAYILLLAIYFYQALK